MGGRGQSRRWRLASALAAGLAAQARAQVPVPPTGPAPAVEPRGGPLHRAFRHAGHVLKDRFIGYHEYFAEPPLGASLYANLGVMQTKAEPHNFLLYRSDFLDGTATLSPGGARRLSLMAARLPGWLGPLVVEWTPERPGLAEARRDAVTAALLGAGLPVAPGRVVVGPSPFPGLDGDEAANNHQILILRDAAAPTQYSVSPTSTATFGGGLR